LGFEFGGEEVPIAAKSRYEAYPSIAYDPSGRLWIAYEEGGRGWGKDYGAYSSQACLSIRVV
jgi:hypothetical protein